MISLYQDPWFTFRFADNRLISRFHVDGIQDGRRVLIFKLDSATGERIALADATAGPGGWVNLARPILMRAGESFIAVPE